MQNWRKGLLVVKKSSLTLCALLSFGVMSVVLHLPYSALGAYPRLIESSQPAIPPGHSQEFITVKFVQGSKVSLREGKLVTLDGNKLKLFYEVLAYYPEAQVERLFSRSEEELHEERKEGEIRSGKELPDLNLYHRLRVPSGTDIMALTNDLINLEIVEIAYPAPLPAPPPQTPDFTNEQAYLNAAPNGIDANFAWTVSGGDGTGMKVIDIEYSWNTSHEDLGKGVGAIIGDPPVDPFNDDNHGTAVLGELIADDNGFGVSGIAHGASLGLVAANTAGGYNVANAVSVAVANTNPGDVILIEQQIAGPNYTGVEQFGLVPVEWVQEVYDAIFVATATGRVIVEAAGNGSQNLDDPVYGGRFDRGACECG